MVSGLAPAVPFGDDLHAETHERPDIGRDKAVAAHDVDHAPACSEGDADLHDARVTGPRGRVDLLAEGDLFGEGHDAERIVGTVHGLVGALRRGGWRGPRGVEQLQRRCGAFDCRFTDFVRVRESGGLAGHPAQPEARRAVIIGGLQPAVVEAERLAGAVLEIELSVVVSGKMRRGETPGAVRVERTVKETPRIERGHAASLSAGPPMKTKRRSQ